MVRLLDCILGPMPGGAGRGLAPRRRGLTPCARPVAPIGRERRRWHDRRPRPRPQLPHGLSRELARTAGTPRPSTPWGACAASSTGSTSALQLVPRGVARAARRPPGGAAEARARALGASAAGRARDGSPPRATRAPRAVCGSSVPRVCRQPHAARRPLSHPVLPDSIGRAARARGSAGHRHPLQDDRGGAPQAIGQAVERHARPGDGGRMDHDLVAAGAPQRIRIHDRGRPGRAREAARPS